MCNQGDAIVTTTTTTTLSIKNVLHHTRDRHVLHPHLLADIVAVADVADVGRRFHQPTRSKYRKKG